MKTWLVLILINFLCLALNSQAKSEIKNLVFEGAGIRGIAYCGAVQEFELRGMMPAIERVGGTSAGAITALIISLGYTGEEMGGIISNTNFKQFNDGRFIFFGGINRVNKYFGWYRGNRFEKWMEKLIYKKTGNADITFEELHRRKFKDLYVTGTCLNKQQLVIFSYESYPKMKIKDAIRISMSIPLYFEAVFVNADGKVIQHPKKIQGLDIMIDGGFISNFPIRIFDSTRYISKYTSNNFAFNSGTLGFRIDNEQQIKKDMQIKDDDSKNEIAPMPINNVKDYLGAFYNIVIENLNRQTLVYKDWERTVSISDGEIGPRVRKLSSAEITILLGNGKEALKKHLFN